LVALSNRKVATTFAENALGAAVMIPAGGRSAQAKKKAAWSEKHHAA
jgi:hypothetical protein